MKLWCINVPNACKNLFAWKAQSFLKDIGVLAKKMNLGFLIDAGVVHVKLRMEIILHVIRSMFKNDGFSLQRLWVKFKKWILLEMHTSFSLWFL